MFGAYLRQVYGGTVFTTHNIIASEATPEMAPKRSGWDWVLEIVSLTVVITIFAVVLSHWTELPAKIPSHFGTSGSPNAWGDKSQLWILPVTAAVLYILLTAASRYQRLINVPLAIDRDAPEVRRLLLSMAIVLKTVMVFVFAYITWANVNTALGRGNGLGRAFLPIMLLATTIPMVIYLMRLRRYRKS